MTSVIETAGNRTAHEKANPSPQIYADKRRAATKKKHLPRRHGDTEKTQRGKSRVKVNVKNLNLENAEKLRRMLSGRKTEWED
jgi:hypothetical protein